MQSHVVVYDFMVRNEVNTISSLSLIFINNLNHVQLCLSLSSLIVCRSIAEVSAIRND